MNESEDISPNNNNNNNNGIKSSNFRIFPNNNNNMEISEENYFLTKSSDIVINNDEFKEDASDIKVDSISEIESDLDMDTNKDSFDNHLENSSFRKSNANNKAGQFSCHLCSFVCLVKEEFRQHLLTHYTYSCDKCDYASRTEGRLKRHIKDFHSSESPDNFSGQKVPSNNPKSLKCKHCGIVSATKEHHWNHQRTHMDAGKCLQCSQCPFITEYKHHLEYHMRNHERVKPYKCPKCQYRCVNKSMLNSHKKSHSNVYQFRCADCSYASKYCHSLKQHLSRHNHQPAPVLNEDGSLPSYDNSNEILSMKRGPNNRITHQSDNINSITNTNSASKNLDSFKHQNNININNNNININNNNNNNKSEIISPVNHINPTLPIPDMLISKYDALFQQALRVYSSNMLSKPQLPQPLSPFIPSAFIPNPTNLLQLLSSNNTPMLPSSLMRLYQTNSSAPMPPILSSRTSSAPTVAAQTTLTTTTSVTVPVPVPLATVTNTSVAAVPSALDLSMKKNTTSKSSQTKSLQSSTIATDYIKNCSTTISPMFEDGYSTTKIKHKCPVCSIEIVEYKDFESHLFDHSKCTNIDAFDILNQIRNCN